MTVTTPPRPPGRRSPQADPDALIEEARALQRRRRTQRGALLAVALGMLVAVAAYATTIGHGSTATTPPGRTPAADERCLGAGLGQVAFVRGGALELLDLHTCATRTLVARGAHGPLSFSADGRWIAFGRGVVPTAGGPVRPLRGTWSTHGDVLATTVGANGLGFRTLAGPTRTLLPDGWGVHDLAFSPDGRTLAVARSTYRIYTQPPPYHQEIWLVDVATGARHRVFAEPPRSLAPAELAGWSPDGRWLLFFEDLQNSASLAADGLPLYALNVQTHAVRRVGSGTLTRRGFTGWCGGAVLSVANKGGRQVTLGDGLDAARPPAFTLHPLVPAGTGRSWNELACRPGGRAAAVAAGPAGTDEPFGQEHRSIWLVPLAGGAPRRLTHPHAPLTDEFPQWSSHGRFVLFVRTTPAPSPQGSLYAYDTSRGKLVGPLARVGTTENYYGSYGWPFGIAWYR